MVVALGPGKFYGSSLPRPRFFTGVKLNDERVDPPAPVMDPLLSWANEAHWSMGGLSFQRHRLQGRIEGSIKKLRAQQDPSRRKKKKATDYNVDAKTRSSGLKAIFLKSLNSESSEEENEETVAVTPSPPPRKRMARKLIDEFEMVAEGEIKRRKFIVADKIAKVSPDKESADAVSSRTRKRRSPAGKKEVTVGGTTGVGVRRTSPRKSMSPYIAVLLGFSKSHLP